MENIRTLDSILAMRLRPHLYIGQNDERSVNTLVQAVVEELLEIGGRRFTITLGADGFATVAGDDSGDLVLPLSPSPSPNEDKILKGTTVSTIGLALTELRVRAAYGVGISVTNAFSERLEVKISHHGSLWEQSYQRGIPQGPLHKTGTSEDQGHGSCFRFLPDREFFSPPEFRCDLLLAHLRGRVAWYEGRISGPQPQGFYEQSAFEKAAQYREARYFLTDEREMDPDTGKPRHIEF
jgi:DNA gyrase subunit B